MYNKASHPRERPFRAHWFSLLDEKVAKKYKIPVSEGNEGPLNQCPCALPRGAAVPPAFSGAHWSLPSDSYQAALEPLCDMRRKCWSMFRERSPESSTGARDRVGDGDFLGYHLLSRVLVQWA